jgi:hypothetical protein
MAVKIDLDIPTLELAEQSWGFSRSASQIEVAQGGKGYVRQWLTGSYTLQPVNETTDFSGTDYWEKLKYRLDHPDPDFRVVADPDWVREVPMHAIRSGGESHPCDYFLNLVIPKQHYEPEGTDLIGHLTDIAILAINNALLMAQARGVTWAYSFKEQPMNAGYMLRFYVDGRPNRKVARLHEFYFGQFILALDSDGWAHLFGFYFGEGAARYLSKFKWSKGDVHGRFHEILIFPHHRNKIEFVTREGQIAPGSTQFYGGGGGILSAGVVNRPMRFAAASQSGNHIVQVREDINYIERDPVTDALIDQYEIVKKSKWYLRSTRALRPFIQISRLAFYSGHTKDAYLYDSPHPIDRRPQVPIMGVPQGDYNSGLLEVGLIDATDRTQFGSSILHKTPQPWVRFTGKMDVLSGGGFSTPWPGHFGSYTTPELNAYTLDKPALFQTVDTGLQQTTKVLNISGARVSPPEQQRVSFSIADRSVIDNFSERGEVPFRCYDTYMAQDGATSNMIEKQRTLWRGTMIESETEDTRVKIMGCEGRGKAHDLLTSYALDLDFLKDPHDILQDARAWKWQDAIKKCFEIGNTPPHKVIFDDAPMVKKATGQGESDTIEWVPASKFNIRFWPDGDTSAQHGGHNTSPSMPGQRWRPNVKAPIYEFVDEVVRGIMGWFWTYDDDADEYHIFKRPSPEAMALIEPKAAFINGSQGYVQQTWEAPGGDGSGSIDVPTYFHRGMKKGVKPAQCTTVIVCSYLFTGEVVRDPVFVNQGITGPSYIDPRSTKVHRFVTITLDNPNGYKSPQHPNPNVNSPEFLRKQRARIFPYFTAGSRAALEWFGRRVYEDFTFGQLYRTFEGPWGDEFTYKLRKWDKILIDGVEYVLDDLHPIIRHDRIKRARYVCAQLRPGVPLPR